MRTYGVLQTTAGPVWVEVATDRNGYNDAVYLTTLCQVLLLNLGESPFYANYGIPSFTSVQTQIPPDLYVARTQAQFAPFFASLTIARATAADGSPIYNISVVSHSGASIGVQVPQPLLDGFGNPVLDGYGNPIFASVTTNFQLPT